MKIPFALYDLFFGPMGIEPKQRAVECWALFSIIVYHATLAGEDATGRLKFKPQRLKEISGFDYPALWSHLQTLDECDLIDVSTKAPGHVQISLNDLWMYGVGRHPNEYHDYLVTAETQGSA